MYLRPLVHGIKDAVWFSGSEICLSINSYDTEEWQFPEKLQLPPNAVLYMGRPFRRLNISYVERVNPHS